MRLHPELWLLDPAVAHLNHGSFGAVPVPVLDAQRRAALSIERSPERFYRAELAPAIDEVRVAVGGFLGTDPAGLALVQNATEAVQVVLDAVDLRPGSEIVYTDHAYGWVKAAIQRACLSRGAVARCVALPPVAGVEAGGDRVAGDVAIGDLATGDLAGVLAATIASTITEHTGLVVLDHITSASALLLPVEAVVAAVRAAGGESVPVLVDGAHAPGLIDHPVPADVDFWLGNLHKWAFAARTAAALVTAPRYRDRVRPLVASAGAFAGYPRSFSYLGTQDPTSYLALPASLSFPEAHLGLTFTQLRRRNRAVLGQGLARLEERLGVVSAPDMGLPMRTVALGVAGDDQTAADWTTSLREAGVEVAITSIAERLHARVSVQAYVSVDDFDTLGAALEPLLAVR